MSKVEGPFMPITEYDFDPTYKLEALPTDYECPLCFMIKEDMLECQKCKQGSCKECLTMFSKKQNAGNVAQGKFECTVCHNVNVFAKPNKIL